MPRPICRAWCWARMSARRVALLELSGTGAADLHPGAGGALWQGAGADMMSRRAVIDGDRGGAGRPGPCPCGNFLMSPDALLAELPLVAILRGVTPARIEGVAACAVRGGHSRHRSAAQFAASRSRASKRWPRQFGDRCLTGAGTVLTPARCRPGGGCRRQAAGDAQHQSGRDRARRGKGHDGDAGLLSPPAKASRPSRRARAYLKLFPASTGGIDHLKAMLAVLPKDRAGLCRGRGRRRQYGGMAQGGRGGLRPGLGPVQARFQRCGNRRPRAANASPHSRARAENPEHRRTR